MFCCFLFGQRLDSLGSAFLFCSRLSDDSAISALCVFNPTRLCYCSCGDERETLGTGWMGGQKWSNDSRRLTLSAFDPVQTPLITSILRPSTKAPVTVRLSIKRRTTTDGFHVEVGVIWKDEGDGSMGASETDNTIRLYKRDLKWRIIIDYDKHQSTFNKASGYKSLKAPSLADYTPRLQPTCIPSLPLLTAFRLTRAYRAYAPAHHGRIPTIRAIQNSGSSSSPPSPPSSTTTTATMLTFF